MAAASVLYKRCQEQEYVNGLNDRFQDYVTRVRQFREQSSRVESTNLATMTKALEDEIIQLKNLYEEELHHLRDQLDEVAREKNSYQLTASKMASKAADLEEKLADEVNNRKKMENAYADALRIIADKDSQLQDARATITQEQNAHLDTQKEKESMHNQLAQTTDLYSNEAASRGDFENLSIQLRDKLEFDRQRSEQEISDYHNRIADLETALRMAEERIHEHNIIDEDLANQLAKVKIQSEVDFTRFKQESEMNYQNSLAHVHNQLDNKCKELGERSDENIKLKANIEELNARNTNAEARANNTENQNQDLIRTLEIERQQTSNNIKGLEETQRDLQENLNEKIRELNAAYNSSLPINVELEALSALLDAEERRLKVCTSEQPQLITRTHLLNNPTSPMIQRRISPPSSILRMRSAKLPTQTTRPSSVTHLPSIVDAPGNIQRQNPLHPGLHTSVPEPLPKPAQTGVPRGYTYTPNYNIADHGCPTSSHTGNMKILEVSSSGKYIRLFNSSTFQDEEIGGFMVQQNKSGRPISVFRFPPRTKCRALTHVTVWAASSLARHNPPSDFLCSTQEKWSTGHDITSIICKPNGQAIAWTTASQPYGSPSYTQTREEPPVGRTVSPVSLKSNLRSAPNMSPVLSQGYQSPDKVSPIQSHGRPISYTSGSHGKSISHGHTQSSVHDHESVAPGSPVMTNGRSSVMSDTLMPAEDCDEVTTEQITETKPFAQSPTNKSHPHYVVDAREGNVRFRTHSTQTAPAKFRTRGAPRRSDHFGGSKKKKSGSSKKASRNTTPSTDGGLRSKHQTKVTSQPPKSKRAVKKVSTA